MAKKKTRKRTAAKKKVTRRSTRTDLTTASMTDLHQELERREVYVAELEDRRNELIDEIEGIDAEIAEYSSAPTARRGRPKGSGRKAGRKPAAGGGKRPKNKMSLVEALTKVLAGNVQSVTDAAASVQKIGYKTNSANFRTIVNQTLIKYPNLYKKVERGQYTAK